MHWFNALNPLNAAQLGVSLHDDRIHLVKLQHRNTPKPKVEFATTIEAVNADNWGEKLNLFSKQQHLKHLPCVSVLPTGEYQLLLVEAPTVPEAEMRAALHWRIQDLLDFHIDDATFDLFELPNEYSNSAKMLYVVVARTQHVQAHIAPLLSARCKLTALDIPEMVLLNIVRLLPEKQHGIAFLHLTPARGLLLLVRDNDLYLARSIEVGAKELLRLLATGQTFYDADEGLNSAIMDATNQVIVEIQRSLDYYDSHYNQPALHQLLLAPMPYDLNGLSAYLAENLGLQVDMLDFNQRLSLDEPMSLADQARYLFVVGAALRQERANG